MIANESKHMDEIIMTDCLSPDHHRDHTFDVLTLAPELHHVLPRRVPTLARD